MTKSLTFSTDNDHSRLELILDELNEMLKRENKKTMYYDPYYQEMLEEVIDKIDSFINYEPSDAEINADVISADERHSIAWKQHQEMHS